MQDAKSSPPLFHQYPLMQKHIPRISIGSLPTPVQRLNKMGTNNLWIKRDDLTSPTYAGNKVRKLAFILADVQAKQKKHIITPGGIGTHHGLATAIFGNRLGMHTTLILFRQPVTENVKQTLLLFTSYNARLVFKRTLFNAMLWYYLFGRIRYPEAYYLYPGGSNPIGTIGYVDAAFELKQQIHSGEMPQPDFIFCPLGSGGTLAGLALGVSLAGLPVSVIGIRVSPARLGPIPATTIGTVSKLMKHTYEYLKNADPNLPEPAWKPPPILDAYLGDGYGHPTTKGMAAYQKLKDKEGIVLDPTYTAKTLAAVLDYCEHNRTSVPTVLFWNTYNGVDLTDLAASANYKVLPEPLQKLYLTKTVQIS